MKKFGFTLGEILIALAVIGVVAGLVLPQLVTGQKAAQARAQFNTAYSLLAKSIADMDADNVSVDPASYGAPQALYKILKEYQRVSIDCGDKNAPAKNTSVCIGFSSANSSTDQDNYHIYNRHSNSKIDIRYLSDGAFVINNGMLFAFTNPVSYKWITIDINGKNKMPNRWGWDLFTFELVKGDILPVGAPGTTATFSTRPQDYCNPAGRGTINGLTCGYFAASNEDYFKDLYLGH